jgi:phage-related protein
MAERRWVLEIDADGRGATREVDRVEDRFERFDVNKGFKAKMAKMSEVWKKGLGNLVGAGKPIAVTAGTAFSFNFIGSVVSGLASGAGKIAHGVAAIGALLPAAALAGGVAFGTLRVAVIGVGDAIKAGLTGDTEAWNEAMKGLSQSGQEFARSIASLRPELDKFKKSVQENFFEQFDERVRRLALTYLPILENTLKLTARGFGQAVAESMKFLQSRSTVLVLTDALRNSQVAVGNVAAAIPNLVAAFVPLIQVGSTFLPGLTGGLEGATARFREFMEEAARTGELRDFIQSGLDKLRELWETAKQLGRIFENVGGIANKIFPNMSSDAGGFLDVVERISEDFNRFLETARGSSTAQTIFNTMKLLVESFFGTLAHLAETLGRVFGPVLPDLAEFLNKLAALKTELITALEPALEVLATVVGATLRGLARLFDFVTNNKVAMAGLTGVIVALFLSWAASAAIAAASTLLAAAPLILVGIAVGILAYLVVKHFDTIKAAIETAFNWVKDNWPLLVAILTGPMAPVILLFVTHFDTIKSIFMVFVDFVLALWNTFGSTILTYVRAVWDSVWQIIQGVFDIIMGIWNVFAAIFTGDWSRAWDGVKQIFSGIWQVIQGILGLALAQIQFVISMAWTAIQVVTSAIWNVIVGVFRTVWALIQLVIQTAVSWVQTTLSTAWGAIQLVVDTVWGAISGTISSVWEGIKTTVRDAIDWVAGKISDVLAVISSTWNDIWEGMGNALSAVWDTISGLVRSGLNLVIDVINFFIRALNNIPGVTIDELNPVGGGGRASAGRQRSGAQEHQAQRRARGGFLTNGPQFLVGEGNPAHREAVIATDPRFRRRNVALWEWAGQQLGVLGGRHRGKPDHQGQRRNGRQGFLPGGIPNPISAVRGAAESAANFARDVSVRMLGPVRNAAKSAVDAIPGGKGPVDWIKGGVKHAIDQIYNWARGKTEEHEASKRASQAAGNNAGFHGGGVERWRSTALQALRMTGSPASWIGSLLRRMNQESGGNPNAINRWDINAQRGDPSGGLMQNIPSAYRSRVAGFPSLRNTNYLHPLGSIVASIVYTKQRYGSGPAGWDRAGGYRGGLRRVPRDDFPMRAHEGERLLNRREAAEYQRRPAVAGGPGIVIQGNVIVQANSEAEGREAAKGFLDVIDERRIKTDARIA